MTKPVFAALLGAGLMMSAPAVGGMQASAQTEASLSADAAALLSSLETAIAAADADASVTALSAVMLNTLVDADAAAETEREALQRLIETADTEAVREAARAVLARQPDTPEGYTAVGEFGGLEGGEIAVPSTPETSDGGGSQY